MHCWASAARIPALAVAVVLCTALLLPCAAGVSAHQQPKPPLAQYATLTVLSKPRGASVYVNNVYVGRTPLRINLPAGTYTIRVYMKGYQPAEQTITLRSGDSRILVFNLLPEAQSNGHGIVLGLLPYVAALIGAAAAVALLASRVKQRGEEGLTPMAVYTATGRAVRIGRRWKPEDVVEMVRGRVAVDPALLPMRTVKDTGKGVNIGGWRCYALLGSGGFMAALLAEKGGVTAVVKVPKVVWDALASGIYLDPHTLTLEGKAFWREVKVMEEVSRLGLPHVVRLVDKGFESIRGIPVPYLVVEYCPRGSLADLLSKVGRLGIATALTIGVQVADTLVQCYENTSLRAHGDLKPGNLLFDVMGIVKISDFNIAALADTLSHGLSQALTSGYGDPEVVAGRARRNDRTDVYALARVIMDSLVGLRWIEELEEGRYRSIEDVDAHHISLISRVDRDLAYLLKKARSRYQSKRPSMEEFRDGLARILAKYI